MTIRTAREIRDKLVEQLIGYTFSTTGNNYSSTIKNLLMSIKILDDMIGDDK